MSTALTRRAAAIVGEILELPPHDRDDAVRKACAGDAALEAEVRSLAQSDRAAGDFLIRPLLAPEADPECIGDYRIVRRINAGGMGVIYEATPATEARADSTVAIKVLRRGMAATEAWRRFGQEAVVLRRLNHPSIARIITTGVHTAPAGGEQPFVVMEYVDGVPINVCPAAKARDVRAILEMGAALCEALDYAHDQGVIHRDVKPGNVLVQPDGRIKLVDFGVARLIGGDDHATTMHTQEGDMVGTVRYMSPEQLLGRADTVDRRADVYAVGAVLHELLTGRPAQNLSKLPPTESGTALDKQAVPPLGAAHPELIGDVETIVSRALQKRIADRYRTAAAMSDDLRRYLDGQPLADHTPSLREDVHCFYTAHPRFAWTLLTVVLLLLGCCILLLMMILT